MISEGISKIIRYADVCSKELRLSHGKLHSNILRKIFNQESDPVKIL